MICLRYTRRLLGPARSTIHPKIPQLLQPNPLKRQFSLLALSHRPLAPRPSSTCPLSSLPQFTLPTTATIPTLTPKISMHPSLRTAQTRNVLRHTFRPSHRKRKRRHGFLARLKSKDGVRILRRRAGKGRSTLSH